MPMFLHFSHNTNPPTNPRHICMHTNLGVCTNTVYMCVCMSVCMHACVYNKYIHIYIYMYILCSNMLMVCMYVCKTCMCICHVCVHCISPCIASNQLINHHIAYPAKQTATCPFNPIMSYDTYIYIYIIVLSYLYYILYNIMQTQYLLLPWHRQEFCRSLSYNWSTAFLEEQKMIPASSGCCCLAASRGMGRPSSQPSKPTQISS